MPSPKQYSQPNYKIHDVYLEIIPGQIGHPYNGRLYTSSEVPPRLMLLCLLCLETHILARSSLGFSVTRSSKSFLAEGDTYGQHMRHCGQLSVALCMVADDNAACALTSSGCDLYPGHFRLCPEARKQLS